MQNRKKFALHQQPKPKPLEITKHNSKKDAFDHPIKDGTASITFHINNLQLGAYYKAPHETSVNGLSYSNTPNSLTITVKPGKDFATCEKAFRAMITDLNKELRGLQLDQLDKIVTEFNRFLRNNGIEAKMDPHSSHHDCSDHYNFGSYAH